MGCSSCHAVHPDDRQSTISSEQKRLGLQKIAAYEDYLGPVYIQQIKDSLAQWYSSDLVGHTIALGEAWKALELEYRQLRIRNNDDDHNAKRNQKAVICDCLFEHCNRSIPTAEKILQDMREYYERKRLRSKLRGLQADGFVSYDQYSNPSMTVQDLEFLHSQVSHQKAMYVDTISHHTTRLQEC